MSSPNNSRSVKATLPTLTNSVDQPSEQDTRTSFPNLETASMIANDIKRTSGSNISGALSNQAFSVEGRNNPNEDGAHDETRMSRSPMDLLMDKINNTGQPKLKLAPPSIPPPPPAFSPTTPRSLIPSSPDSATVGSNTSTPSSRFSTSRKMVTVSRMPSDRNLKGGSNIWGTIDVDTSALRRQQSDDTLLTSSSGYHEGDELASFIHGKQSVDVLSENEGDDEMSNAGEKKPSFSHRTKAIGSPKSDAQEPQAKLGLEEKRSPQTKYSKTLAANIAAEERDMKLKARGGPRGELGRRRSAPIQYRRQVSRMSLVNDQLPEDLKPSKKPIRASYSGSAVDSNNGSGISSLQIPRGKPSPRSSRVSSVRPRRSSSNLTASSSSGSPRDFKDRNDKIRAAMSAMGTTSLRTEGFEVTPRKRPPPPPPTSSRSPMTTSGHIGLRSRKTLGGLEERVSSPCSSSPMTSSGSIGCRNRKTLASLEEQRPRSSSRSPMTSSIGSPDRKTLSSLEGEQQMERPSKTRTSVSSLDEVEEEATWTVTARTPPKFRSSAMSRSTMDENEPIKPAPRPPSLRPAVSSAETVTSGISMDTYTRNSIIEESTAAHVAMRRTETRGRKLCDLEAMDNNINEKIAARTSPRLLATLAGSPKSSGNSCQNRREENLARGASARPSDEKAAYRSNPSSGDLVARHSFDNRRVENLARGASARPSDEKAAYRSNPSSGDLVARHSFDNRRVENLARGASARPSDEKAAYRPNHSSVDLVAQHRPCSEKEASRTPALAPGAYNVVRYSTPPSQEKGLRMAAAAHSFEDAANEGSVPHYEHEMDTDYVSGVVEYDEHDAILDEETIDLPVQTGVPLIQPGAFAIDGVGNGGHGYSSDIEDGDIETPGDNGIRDGEEPLQSAIESTLSHEADTTAFQAELYEHHLVVGEVLIDENGTKAKKQLSLMQGLFVLLIFLGAVAVSLGLIISRRSTRASVAVDGDGIPTIEGWSQLGATLIGPIEDNIKYGFSVAMSGDGTRLVVGMPGTNLDTSQLDVGSVAIMDFNGTSWVDIGLIEGKIPGGEAGKTVAISKNGRRVAVGAPGAEGGRVEVYEENEWNDWEMVGSTFNGTSNASFAFFGASLALSSDGKLIAISGTSADTTNDIDVGRVQVFKETNSSWELVGDDIEGEKGHVLFGWALALSSDGQRIAASSLGTDNAGTVRCFELDGGSWKQLGQTLSGDVAREHFGRSIALSADGSIMAVGSPEYSNGISEPGVGRVRVFQFERDTWTQMGQSLEGTNKLDAYGETVALSSSGTTLAIGAPQTDTFEIDSGHAQVQVFDGSRWNQLGSDLGATVSRGSRFGLDLALTADGDQIALGAPFSNYDGTKSDVGQVRVFVVEEET